MHNDTVSTRGTTIRNHDRRQPRTGDASPLRTPGKNDRGGIFSSTLGGAVILLLFALGVMLLFLY
jgi:hypothetical protein